VAAAFERVPPLLSPKKTRNRTRPASGRRFLYNEMIGVMPMTHRTFFLKSGAVCLALIALASCRPEEQGRPLHYEQGVYPGKHESTPLSDADLAQLRQRALMQGGIAVGGNAGQGAETTGSDVRPPAPAQ